MIAAFQVRWAVAARGPLKYTARPLRGAGREPREGGYISSRLSPER